MRYNTYEEIMASDVVEPLSIDNNQSLEYAVKIRPLWDGNPLINF